jgi:transketolase
MDAAVRASDPQAHWVVADPAQLAARIRLRAVHMVAPHGLGYLGQALSAAEQIAALFATARPGTDRIVCSPGHYVIGLYAAAAELGLIRPELLATYGQDGSMLEAIGTERSPVVDWAGGSLGQGLSVAAGFALADRLRGSAARTFVMVSDGEMEEGQVWEAAMFAAHHGLSSLTVVLDANNSQVDGPVDAVTTIEPITAKWEAFGWHAAEVNGHDVRALCDELAGATTANAVDDPLMALARHQRADDGARPTVLICRTSARHGLDCLPADADGHFVKLPAELAERAVAELSARLAAPSGRP